jgi:hypothetical protein
MAYRIVAKSPEKLDDILTDIKDWFGTTKDYVSKFETEKRKFADPATKQIVSKDIDVIYVKDPMTKKETKIMLIPLLKPGEMKVEMGGENEHVMKGKIKNMMKGRGDFKTYNKDTLRKMEAVEKLRSVIREEVAKILEGRKPGPKEQKRREVYSLAGKYIYNNQKYKSFSFDDDTNEFHFYTSDWSVSNSSPALTIPYDELKNLI